MSAALPGVSYEQFEEAMTCIRVLERDILILKIAHEKEIASEEWVKELVEPIKDNTRETRLAVEEQRREMKIFIEAHTKAMEQRAEQDKKEHEAKLKALESQTWSAIIKEKWQPLATFVVALAVILSYAALVAMSWLSAHGVPIK